MYLNKQIKLKAYLMQLQRHCGGRGSATAFQITTFTWSFYIQSSSSCFSSQETSFIKNRYTFYLEFQISRRTGCASCRCFYSSHSIRRRSLNIKVKSYIAIQQKAHISRQKLRHKAKTWAMFLFKKKKKINNLFKENIICFQTLKVKWIPPPRY